LAWQVPGGGCEYETNPITIDLTSTRYLFRAETKKLVDPNDFSALYSDVQETNSRQSGTGPITRKPTMKMFSMLAVFLGSLGHSFHVPRITTQPMHVKRGKTKRSRGRFGRTSGSLIKGIKSTNMTSYGRNLKTHFDNVRNRNA
jgi:hypothetical protein